MSAKMVNSVYYCLVDTDGRWACRCKQPHQCQHRHEVSITLGSDLVLEVKKKREEQKEDKIKKQQTSIHFCATADGWRL